MADTRERILSAALRLFARDGYEAVPVSRIAGELGMTKGALYKHFASKRDIFDSLLARMEQRDAARAEGHRLPQGTRESAPESYRITQWEDLCAFTLGQLRFWAEDEFAAAFRRMLTLEQYRSAEMAELYQRTLVRGPVEYTADLFEELMEKGVLAPGDARALAAAYFAPLFLLLALVDGGLPLDEAERLLQENLKNFLSRAKAAKER